MAIEDQPAVFFDRFVEHAVDAIAVDIAIDQRRGAQEMQIDGAAVDAGKDAARRAERFSELPLARYRSEAIRIGEILDLDRGVERQQETSIVLRLRGHRRRIEIAGAQMRKCVAGDFMAVAVKANDVIGAGSDPVAGPLIGQPAGYIEGSPRAILLEHRSADRGRTFGNVVERET